MVDINVIKQRLAKFATADEIEQMVNEVTKKSGLSKKQFYAPEEIDSMLDNLIPYGGFIEFTARLMKSKMALDGTL